MRDEIQKNVRSFFPIDATDIAFHCIAYEKPKLFPPIARKKLVLLQKNGLGHSTTKRTYSVPPASCAPFFGGLQETRPTFDSLERFSVPIGEVNMISITAVKYIIYNVNCT